MAMRRNYTTTTLLLFCPALKELKKELTAALEDVEGKLDQLGGSASTVSTRVDRRDLGVSRSDRAAAQILKHDVCLIGLGEVEHDAQHPHAVGGVA